MKEETKFFKALANERRLLILNHLNSGGPYTVSEIAGLIKLSFKSTSRHLQVLYTAGLIRREQVGLEMNYWFNQDHKALKKSANEIIEAS